MRSLILVLSLALAAPMMPTMAAADGHNCNQLRQGVVNRAPLTTRNLPYHALSCAAISELHLLLIRSRSISSTSMTQRIESVFRREGLIR